MAPRRFKQNEAIEDNFISLEIASLDQTHAYDLLVAAVQPRPIALVSTFSRDGRPNLAPFSFFVAGGVNPLSVVFSATIAPNGEMKHSMKNIEETGEYVINTVTRDIAEHMNAASFSYPRDYSEWKAAGLTPLDADMVKPCRVAESPIHLECKLFQIVHHGHGPGAACYAIGEVIKIHISPSVWNGETIDPLLFRPLSRLGGPNYLDTASLEIFAMSRPTVAAEPSIEA